MRNVDLYDVRKKHRNVVCFFLIPEAYNVMVLAHFIALYSTGGITMWYLVGVEFWDKKEGYDYSANDSESKSLTTGDGGLRYKNS